MNKVYVFDNYEYGDGENSPDTSQGSENADESNGDYQSGADNVPTESTNLIEDVS